MRTPRVLAAGGVLAAAVTVVALAGPAGPATAVTARPGVYHTISATLGYAVASRTDGCVRTEVFVSSSVDRFPAQPGTSGLTGVLVRLVDACAVSAAAAGPPPLAEYEGVADVPLTAEVQLRSASVTADVPGTDADGAPVTIHVDAAWTPTGPIEKSREQSHVLFPGEGVVSSFGELWQRPSTAVVTAVARDAGGARLAGLDAVTADETVLQQSKALCIEVPRPGVADFYPCFGFPG